MTYRSSSAIRVRNCVRNLFVRGARLATVEKEIGTQYTASVNRFIRIPGIPWSIRLVGKPIERICSIGAKVHPCELHRRVLALAKTGNPSRGVGGGCVGNVGEVDGAGVRSNAGLGPGVAQRRGQGLRRIWQLPGAAAQLCSNKNVVGGVVDDLVDQGIGETRTD